MNPLFSVKLAEPFMATQRETAGVIGQCKTEAMRFLWGREGLEILPQGRVLIWIQEYPVRLGVGRIKRRCCH